ncbi:hypothetical protein SAMN02927924_01342 [Sphingobium faniae]|nr:hypothetical protein SAMN02927924_01342 [Sphingobium faniae]
MARARTLHIHDLPIPADVQADAAWPPIMLEMAAHIGAYETLCIVDAFAGQDVYVPVDPHRNPFLDIIGADKAATFTHAFQRERLPIPAGRRPLEKARRAGVVAAVRAKRMTVVEGAAILRMPRRHLSRLISKTDEGSKATPFVFPARPRDPAQLDMFDTAPGQ